MCLGQTALDPVAGQASQDSHRVQDSGSLSSFPPHLATSPSRCIPGRGPPSQWVGGTVAGPSTGKSQELNVALKNINQIISQSTFQLH